MCCLLLIETEDRALRDAAAAFKSQHPALFDGGGEKGLILAMRDEGWELRDASTRPGRGVRIDFRWLGDRRADLSRRQPLARAMGRSAQRIIDATAGLGDDAALLAAIGFDVLAIERHPILAAMLQAAIEQAGRDPAMPAGMSERLRVMHGDAREILAKQSHDVDCIYLDPMFPPKRRASALPGKEIRMVRALVGDDDDASELLMIARTAAPRVAVKRPTHAPPLANDVTGVVRSKLLRYDIYVDHGAVDG